MNYNKTSLRVLVVFIKFAIYCILPCAVSTWQYYKTSVQNYTEVRFRTGLYKMGFVIYLLFFLFACC